MAGSIICGVDDSESAKGAARAARALSARLRLPLIFVRVVEDASASEEIGAIVARLHDLADSTTEVDCSAGWIIDVGHPADRLVAAAEDENATFIVVGSTGPRSSLLGSISADVSRRAPCPVVVVAPGADRPLANGHGESRQRARRRSSALPAVSRVDEDGPEGRDSRTRPAPEMSRSSQAARRRIKAGSTRA